MEQNDGEPLYNMLQSLHHRHIALLFKSYVQKYILDNLANRLFNKEINSDFFGSLLFIALVFASK